MCIFNCKIGWNYFHTEHTESKRLRRTALNFLAFAHIPATVPNKISLSSTFAVVPSFLLSNNLRDKVTEQIKKNL